MDREQLYALADRVSSRTERWTDRIVSTFRGHRARARRAHDRLLERDENYASAARMAARMGISVRGMGQGLGENETPWLGLSDRDADGDQIPELHVRRRRSRYLEQKDGTAAGLFRLRQRKVVGSGLRLQVRSGDDTVNDAFEEIWKERKDQLFPAEGGLSNVAGQRMIFTRRDVDGDILVLPTVSSPGEPLWFEVVEADRISTPLDVEKRLIKGHSVVEGVEKDALGRTVAFWVARRHPGESILGPWRRGKFKRQTRSVADYVRVPYERGKLFRSRVSRPGQSRGLPLLYAVEEDLHDLDVLLHATLKRAQIAACLTLFITSETELDDFFTEDGGRPHEQPWGYDVNQHLRPGEFFRLAPGEKVEAPAAEGLAPDLEPFVWLYAMRIGAAIDLSPHAVLGDRGRINYSGARTVELEDRIIYDLERCDFAAELLDWQARLVWVDAIRRGDPRLAFASVEDALTVETNWIGDARRWVDPMKEGQAIELALRLCLTTLQIEAAALGHDWEALVRQRAKEKKLLKELDLADAEVLQAPNEPNEPEEDDPEDEPIRRAA